MVLRGFRQCAWTGAVTASCFKRKFVGLLELVPSVKSGRVLEDPSCAAALLVQDVYLEEDPSASLLAAEDRRRLVEAEKHLKKTNSDIVV